MGFVGLGTAYSFPLFRLQLTRSHHHGGCFPCTAVVPGGKPHDKAHIRSIDRAVPCLCRRMVHERRGLQTQGKCYGSTNVRSSKTQAASIHACCTTTSSHQRGGPVILKCTALKQNPIARTVHIETRSPIHVGLWDSHLFGAD